MIDSRIPQIIHYCWFGGKPLPCSARRCIASWRKYLPEYEIREWNEDNFDVNAVPYTREAYVRGKYAFVSDYARFWVLYHYGGLYFDTDVEVIQSFDDIMARGAFMGIEKDGENVAVAPGLGMGAVSGMVFYRDMIKYYLDWNAGEDTMQGILVSGTTDMLGSRGFVKENRIQTVAGIWIYPSDYFDPMDDYTGKINLTENTRTIHYYTKSWADGYGPFRNFLLRRYHRLKNMFGRK